METSKQIIPCSIPEEVGEGHRFWRSLFSELNNRVVLIGFAIWRLSFPSCERVGSCIVWQRLFIIVVSPRAQRSRVELQGKFKTFAKI